MVAAEPPAATFRAGRRDFRNFEFAERSRLLLSSKLPLISVVLPVYNHCDFIASAVSSVLSAAKRYPLELIIVDDGSTDAELTSILAPFLRTPNVKLISQQHAGIATALNTGFRFTTGDYLTWTSADNLYHQGALDRLADFLQANPAIGLTYANVRLIDATGEPATDSEYRRSDQNPNSRSELLLPYSTDSLLDFPDNFINACFLYRREAGQFAGEYCADYLGFEDYDYWLKISLAYKLAHVDSETPLYDYRLHQRTLTARLDWPAVLKRQATVLERYREIRQAVSSESYAKSSNQCAPIVRDAAQKTFIEQVLVAKELATGLVGYIDRPVLRRARDCDFGAIVADSESPFRALVFPVAFQSPAQTAQMLTAIDLNPDITWGLFCGETGDRKIADEMHLRLTVRRNLRIVDVSENRPEETKLQGLMYALSSVDAIVCFVSHEISAAETNYLFAAAGLAAYGGLPLIIVGPETNENGSEKLSDEPTSSMSSRIRTAPHICRQTAIGSSETANLSRAITHASEHISIASLEQWLAELSYKRVLTRSNAFQRLHARRESSV